MGPAPSLISTFSSADVDTAHANLRAMYVDYSVRISGPSDNFSYSNTMMTLDSVLLARMQHSMTADFTVDGMPTPTILQQMVPDTLAFTVSRDTVRMASGTSAVLPGATPFTCTWKRADYFAVFLDPDLLHDDTTAAGREPVTFRLGAAVSAAADAHWGQVSGFVRSVVSSNPYLTDSPLLRRELIRLLNTAAPACFDPTPITEAHARAATPDALRRAVAYIDEHVADPIGLTQIAEAARMSPRALQAAFRRHLDTTPLGYLRTARLDHAHRELLAAAPEDGRTVAQIAARWGFTQPSRFAAEHQRRYRTRPGEVLRRAASP